MAAVGPNGRRNMAGGDGCGGGRWRSWVPRLSLASKNVASTLIDRESRRTPQGNYPGEWDHKIPNKKVSSPEWKPSKETVEKNLMEKLGEAAKEFEKAYNFMMRIVGDLEDHYYEGNKKE